MIPDTVIALDWSSRSAPSPKLPVPDAIYSCLGRKDIEAEMPIYHRTRLQAFEYLRDTLDAEITAGRKVMLGVDFALGYPQGAAKILCGSDDPLAIWDYLANVIEDDEKNINNRFEVAARINQKFLGVGPFWGCPANKAFEGLPHKGTNRHGHGMKEHRFCEGFTKSAQSVWKLFTTGSVGSQSLVGLPMLVKLRTYFKSEIAVWPFENIVNAKIVIAEIYPSLFDISDVKDDGILAIKDAKQVYKSVQNFLDTDIVRQSFDHRQLSRIIREEGWILGIPLPEETSC